MSTFHVNPVCVDIHVEVLVQILLCGALANLFDFQETPAPRPRPMLGLSRRFLRQRERRDVCPCSHRRHALLLARDWK